MSKFSAFNAVINGNYITKAIQKEKSKITKPTLSDEQISHYEKLIFESHINKTILSFKLFNNGFINYTDGFVSHILKNEKKIIINYKQTIYFCEIIALKHKIG